MDGGIGASNNNFARFNGANVTPAWAMDSMFGTLASTGGATGQQLTRFFSLHGAIEHYWTPALRSSLWGTYTQADYNDIATTYNTVQMQFPTNLVAGLAKAVPADLWEIEDAAERNVPKVDLGFGKSPA